MLFYNSGSIASVIFSINNHAESQKPTTGVSEDPPPKKKAKQQERQSAFGGGRDAYDPKNPHRRAGSATAKRPATNRAATTQRSSPQNATARKLAAKSVVKKLADPTNVEKIAVGALNISDPIPA